MWRNTPQAWGWVSKSLHWLIAVLIVVQVGLGAYASDLKLSPQKLDMFVWHKSVGLLILVLVIVRVLWRLIQGRPEPVVVSPLQRSLAGLTHFALYALLLLIPVSGWVVNSAAGVPLKAFWAVPVPDLVGPNEQLKELAAELHEAGIALLSVILLLHVAAAVWHHVVRRDPVLRRMWFGG
jgi:cytochrome b561